MAKNELSNRDNWQTESGPGGLAGVAEKNLFSAFSIAFKDTEFEIIDHPTHLKHLYEYVKLSREVLSQIYCPDDKTMENAQKRGWGVSPDFAIRNKRTGKILRVIVRDI